MVPKVITCDVTVSRVSTSLLPPTLDQLQIIHLFCSPPAHTKYKMYLILSSRTFACADTSGTVEPSTVAGTPSIHSWPPPPSSHCSTSSLWPPATWSSRRSSLKEENGASWSCCGRLSRCSCNCRWWWGYKRIHFMLMLKFWFFYKHTWHSSGWRCGSSWQSGHSRHNPAGVCEALDHDAGVGDAGPVEVHHGEPHPHQLDGGQPRLLVPAHVVHPPLGVAASRLVAAPKTANTWISRAGNTFESLGLLMYDTY